MMNLSDEETIKTLLTDIEMKSKLRLSISVSGFNGMVYLNKRALYTTHGPNSVACIITFLTGILFGLNFG